MNNINVELHTKSNLEVGTRLIGKIKETESLTLNETVKSISLTPKVSTGRRNRVIGYLNNMPLYTDYTSNDVVSAMEKEGLEEIELIVNSVKGIQSDDRFVYELVVNNYDVANSMLLSSSKLENIVSNLDDIVDSKNEVLNNGDSELSIKELITIALKDVEPALVDESTEDDLRVIQFPVAGKAKDNPAKTKISKMVKEGEFVELELKYDDNGILRTVFEGELAGEVELEDEKIKISDVKTVMSSSYRPLGYFITVNVEEKNQKEIKVTQEQQLFVDVAKVVLKEELAKSEVAMTLDDIISNDDIISKISKMVANSNTVYTDGNLAEKTTSDVKNEAKVSVVKEIKAKKIDKEEIKEIVKYLTINGVPEKYINKIINSYKSYPVRYLERIPSMKDKKFTLWKHDITNSLNLLKMAIISIEKGKNLRLTGGKGAGKNTLLSTLAWIYQRPLFSQSANRDTDITHIFGDKTIEVVEVDGQISQKVEFEKGLLIEAMEIGGFYEFGEGNACRPEVTMALHSVLDSRREADVNGYKLVKADEDFNFVLTMNVDYEGCNSLNEAFRDRFVTIPFPSPRNITQVLKEACPNASNKDIETCNKLYSHILDKANELQDAEIITVRGYINALDLAEDLDLKTALELCVAHNVSDDEMLVRELLEIIDSVVA